MSFEHKVLCALQAKAQELCKIVEKEDNSKGTQLILNIVISESTMHRKGDNLDKMMGSLYIESIFSNMSPKLKCLIRDLFVLTISRFVSEEDFYDEKNGVMSAMMFYVMREALGESELVLVNNIIRSQLGNCKKHLSWIMSETAQIRSENRKRRSRKHLVTLETLTTFKL